MAEQVENLNNDDKGGDTGLGSGGSAGPNTTNSGTTIPGKSNTTLTSPTMPASGGTTGSNGNFSNTTQSTYGVNAPNPEKLKNPLSVFSSYNYQLSLYMITPAAYARFVASGKTSINAINLAAQTSDNIAVRNQQAYIVAQSGGVNSNENRADGFQYDYYIDNLKIDISTPGPATQSATNITGFSFQVIEPYGFNFVSQLRRARDEIIKISGGSVDAGPARQLFILGIRFLGYDKDGNLITGKESFAGKTLDQKGTQNGVLEIYYDIMITEFKYSIDGKNVTYNIKARATSANVAFGTKYGEIDNGGELKGETVEEMLTNLIDKLNKTSQEVNKTVNSNPNTYKIEFVNAEKIQKAKMIYKTNNDIKQKAPSTAKNTAEVNDARASIGPAINTNIADANDARVAARANRTIDTSITDPNDARVAAANRILDANDARVTAATRSSNINDANPTPANPNVRVFSVNTGSTVLQTIDQIIAQSTYLQEALLVLKKSSEQQQANTKNQTQVTPDSNQKVAWYNISARVIPKGWDKVRNDFSWEITYIIQPYETPAVLSPYVSNRGYYYGPVKRYEYWYSGTNSEILSYKQDLNYNYFGVTMVGAPTVPTGADVAQIPNKVNNQNRSASENEGLEAVNSYRTSLYDPGAWATAKIEILGDPDFLIQDGPAPLSTVYQQFYNNNGTINANGGQVFIEISFKEAIDYDKEKGLMDINSSIFFYNYPKEVRDKIQGLSFQVIKCTNTFNQGKFKQDLDLKINNFPGIETTTTTTTTNTSIRENQKPTTTNSSGGSKQPVNTETSTSNRDQLRYIEQKISNDYFKAPVTVKTKTGIVATDEVTASNQRVLGVILDQGGRGG